MSEKYLLKRFKLNTIDEYIYYLNFIMCHLYSLINRYNRYLDELNNVIEGYGKQTVIKLSVYEEFNDKLLSVSRGIISLCADEQDVSISYKKFRKLLEKSKLIRDLTPLSDELQKILRELLDVRNWSFHYTESQLNAKKEMELSQFPDELRKKLKVSRDPNIIITNKKYCYISNTLLSLSMHTTTRLKMFEKVFQQVKNDYSTLIGSSVTIISQCAEEPEDLSYLATRYNTSMKIQKGRLKNYNELKDILKTPGT